VEVVEEEVDNLKTCSLHEMLEELKRKWTTWVHICLLRNIHPSCNLHHKCIEEY